MNASKVEYLNNLSINCRYRRYGLYPDDTNSMYAEQDGKCAICGVPKSLRGKSGIQLDHCHKTGLIRGLLCTECNKNLMPIVDNKTHLIFKAMDYKYKKWPVRKNLKWDGIKFYKSDTNMYRKAANIFMKYGVNIEEHERMYSEHNGRCAICEKHKTMRGRGGLVIDHCHEEGFVRGLICKNCNSNLMRFVDNKPHLIIKAFEYQGKKHRQKTRRKRHKLFDLAIVAKENRSFISWSGTDLCELIVLIAGKPMIEKEVTRVMNSFGIKVNRTVVPLLRACKINATTREDMPNKEESTIVRVNVDNKTFYVDKRKTLEN